MATVECTLQNIEIPFSNNGISNKWIDNNGTLIEMNCKSWDNHGIEWLRSKYTMKHEF